MKRLLILIGVLIFWVGGTFTYALNIPLTVKDEAGKEREIEPVCSGVPIPQGVLYGTDNMRIERNGSPVLAQFSVLSKRARHSNGCYHHRSVAGGSEIVISHQSSVISKLLGRRQMAGNHQLICHKDKVDNPTSFPG